MSQTAKHQPHLHEKMGPTAFEHDLHAASRDDLTLEIFPHRALHLFLQAPLKSVNKALGEGVPRRAFEGVWLGVHHVIPNTGHQEKMGVMSLGNERKNLRASGVLGEGLDKFQRPVRSPCTTEDFR